MARFQEAFSAAAKAALHRFYIEFNLILFLHVSSSSERTQKSMFTSRKLQFNFSVSPKEGMSQHQVSGELILVSQKCRLQLGGYIFLILLSIPGQCMVVAIVTAKTCIRCETYRILLYECQAFLIKSKSVLRC